MKTKIIIAACLLFTACAPREDDGANYWVTYYHGDTGVTIYRARQVDSSYGVFRVTLTNGETIQLQGSIKVERIK